MYPLLLTTLRLRKCKNVFLFQFNAPPPSIGRILAEFQSSSFLATLKLATKELNTNRQHGLLLILKNLSALSTAEDMTADSRTSIEQLLNELYAGSNCYVIKMICFDIQERERLVNVFVVQLRTRLSIFFFTKTTGLYPQRMSLRWVISSLSLY